MGKAKEMLKQMIENCNDEIQKMVMKLDSSRMSPVARLNLSIKIEFKNKELNRLHKLDEVIK